MFTGTFVNTETVVGIISFITCVQSKVSKAQKIPVLTEMPIIYMEVVLCSKSASLFSGHNR